MPVVKVSGANAATVVRAPTATGVRIAPTPVKTAVFILFPASCSANMLSLVKMASSTTIPIWVIVNIFQAHGASSGGKVLWTLLILFLPVIGLIIWWFAGPRAIRPQRV